MDITIFNFDIINIINNNLDYKDIINFSLTNKYFYEMYNANKNNISFQVSTNNVDDLIKSCETFPKIKINFIFNNKKYIIDDIEKYNNNILSKG